MRWSLTLFALFISALAWGQMKNPVKWSTSYKQVSATEFDLVFTATIEDGWTVYSQFLDSDDGPVPTSFNFDKGDHYQLKGKCSESGNIKTVYDKVFEMNLTKITKKGVFTQRVTATDLSKPITGYLEFMTCDDEQCLPPKSVDFEFQLKNSNAGSTTPPDAKQGGGASGGTEKTPAPDQQKQEAPAAPTITDIAPAPAAPKMYDPAKWQFDYKKISATEYDLILTATLDKGWNIYSQFTDPNNGPLPTTFTFTPGEHFSLDRKSVV